MTHLEPVEAVSLLRWFYGNGFAQILGGGTKNPSVMVLSRKSGSVIDIAHVRGADRTEVARASADTDALAPTLVIWHYYGLIVPALEALKNFVSAELTGDDLLPYRPPRAGTPCPLSVTDDERRKLAIRFPRNYTVGRS